MVQFIEEGLLIIIYIIQEHISEQMEGNLLVNELKIKLKAKGYFIDMMEDAIQENR